MSALAGETDDIKTDDDDVIDSHACMVLRRSLNAFYNNKQVTLEMKFKKKKTIYAVWCVYHLPTHDFFRASQSVIRNIRRGVIVRYAKDLFVVFFLFSLKITTEHVCTHTFYWQPKKSLNE